RPPEDLRDDQARSHGVVVVLVAHRDLPGRTRLSADMGSSLIFSTQSTIRPVRVEIPKWSAHSARRPSLRITSATVDSSAGSISHLAPRPPSVRFMFHPRENRR